MTASLNYVFGFHCHVNHGLAFQGNKTILFLSGKMCVFHSVERDQQKFLPFPEMHYPTALARGPKNFLAVADKDERATVTMYDVESSVKKIMPDPEIDIQEYVCLCFSSDFKYIAAQGGPPSWAMPVWTWDKKTLKTVYIPSPMQPHMEIIEICFHPRDNDQIVAVGKNYFRLYKFEGEEGFKPFIFSKYESQGDFLSIAWLPKERLAIGTGDGKVLMFDGIEQRYEIVIEIPDETKGKAALISKDKDKGDQGKETEAVNQITCLRSTSKGILCVYGNNTVVEYVRTDDNKDYKFKQAIHIPTEPSVVQIDLGEVVDVEDKITFMELSPDEDILAVCTDRGQIFQYNLEYKEIKKTIHKSFNPVTQPVHKEGVVALDMAVKRPIIVSCSNHTLIFWNYMKRKREMQKKFYDKILSVAIHPLALYLVIGFTEYARVFTILTNGLTEVILLKVKHCTEVSFSHAGHFFAIANGSSIEVYNFITLEKVALFKGHHGVLKKFEWNENDTILVSCDDKGAIYVWDMISKQRVTENVIKGTAYNSVAVKGEGKETEIFAVGNDKTIREFVGFELQKEVPTGAELTTLALSYSGNMLFGATMEGCLRAFKFPLTPAAAFVDFDCHSGKVTKLCIAFGDEYLVTSSVDGMISLWKITDKEKKEKVTVRFSMAILIDQDNLKRHFDTIKNLEAKLDEIELENQYQLRLKEMALEQQLRNLSIDFEKRGSTLNADVTRLCQEKSFMLSSHEEDIVRLEVKYRDDMDSFERETRNKLLYEYQRYDELVKKNELDQQTLIAEMTDLKAKNEKETEELIQLFEKQLMEKNEIINKERELNRIKDENYEELWQQLQNEANTAVTEVKCNFSRDIQIHKEEVDRLKDAYEIAKKKISNQQKDIDCLREEVKQRTIEEKKLKSVISDLEKEIAETQTRVQSKNNIIQQLQESLFALNQDKQELEKHEFVASFSYDALRKEIEPKENEIANYKKLVKQLNADLEILQKSANMDQKEIATLNERLRATETHLKIEKTKVRNTQTVLDRIRSDLLGCSSIILEPKKLREHVKLLMRTHLTAVQKEMVRTNFDLNAEFAHQRDHLEKSIDVLRHRLLKESKKHRTEYVRMVQENSQLIKSINQLRQELRSAHKKIQDMEAALGLTSAEFATEGNATRLKLDAAVTAIRKKDTKTLEELVRKEAIIERQQEELRRLQALLVVDSDGKIFKT